MKIIHLLDSKSERKLLIEKIQKNGGRFENLELFLSSLTEITIPLEDNFPIEVEDIKKRLAAQGYFGSRAEAIAEEEYSRLRERAVNDELRTILKEVKEYARAVEGQISIHPYIVEGQGLGRKVMQLAGKESQKSRLPQVSEWYEELALPEKPDVENKKRSYDPFPYISRKFSKFFSYVKEKIMEEQKGKERRSIPDEY